MRSEKNLTEVILRYRLYLLTLPMSDIRSYDTNTKCYLKIRKEIWYQVNENWTRSRLCIIPTAVKEFFRDNGIHLKFSPVRAPQRNDSAERFI